MLFERGLAYQAESMVNWDPVDETVLANEQVDANGCSWRSGAKVEKKMLNQWFLKIKEFQKPLLEDLDALAENGMWPDRVLAMQKNWIGRSEGTRLSFHVEIEGADPAHPESLHVYTTRADTLFGVMYLALSLNHPLVQRIARKSESLQQFLDRAKDFPPDSKEGFLLPGIHARNPVAGLVDDDAISENLPIFVAPYVLDDYGSGAVMGVPGHDTRDFAFWAQPKTTTSGEAWMDAPVKVVIYPERLHAMPSYSTKQPVPDQATTNKGFLVSRDPRFNDISSDEAIEKITELLQSAGKVAERTENWRLRDWLISRQRYWGCPIPIVHCDSCGPVAVPPNDLPVELPDLPASFFKGQKGNPLAENNEFKQCKCPKCNKPAERETDTMDTFMDSSWYFFRYLDAQNKAELVDPKMADSGMPIDVYIGGVEHAILHLLYARFISKFLATTSVWPSGSKSLGEPFKRLITQGMVHGKTYSDPATGRFLRPEEVDLSKPSEPVIRGTEIVPKISYEKMSKSKYNGVDPVVTITKYGADVTRAHMLFQAPVTDVLEWDEQKITGVQRWLARVVRLSEAKWVPSVVRFLPLHDLDMPVIPLLDFLQTKACVLKPSPLSQTPSKTETKEDELINAMHHMDMTLLSTTHKTIASVTKAYSETYSLNTIVSDLMTLTNTIWDTPHSSPSTPWFKWYATVQLLRMAAPIAPGVAEEGWQTLITMTNDHVRTDRRHPLHDFAQGKPGPSIFTFGFPQADIEMIPKLNPTTTCVVQINGKRKFQADIRKVPSSVTDHLAQRDYVLKEIFGTEEGQKYLGRRDSVLWKESETQEAHEQYPSIPKGWNVIIVKGGKLVNFVAPKRRKPKDQSA